MPSKGHHLIKLGTGRPYCCISSFKAIDHLLLEKKIFKGFHHIWAWFLFVCVEVLRPSQPNGVMSSAVSLPNHTFTGQA